MAASSASEFAASSCSSRSARSAPLLPDDGDGAHGLLGSDIRSTVADAGGAAERHAVVMLRPGLLLT